MKSKNPKTSSPPSFDIKKFATKKSGRYEQHLRLLKTSGKQTDCIESAVRDAILNIVKHKTRSFVIYGEPQSGKTEMMIALTGILLDKGFKIVVHLLNDSVDLLSQNLRRFRTSGLSPSPKNYKDILDPQVHVDSGEYVLFCKKNAGDLQKLLDKLRSIDRKVIIDDEADYASPNSRINKAGKSPINDLIEQLIGQEGIYIGVTATPARLDLNNTFENDHEKWVDFPMHSKYTGQDVFFPIGGKRPRNTFKLHFLPDEDDTPPYIKRALFRYFVNAAYLNLKINKFEENYSMLIHTSGHKVDHRDNKIVIESLASELNEDNGTPYTEHLNEIWQVAYANYPGMENEITQYIVNNKSRIEVIVLNSDKNGANLEEAANPSSPFTIVIGGNIVSRGVTFNNLLSMFFTRDVRNRIQQDTYIQRARMFGARGSYLRYFELTIPRLLYADWHRCFIFQRLAITAIRSGKGAPVWLADRRIAAASPSSIDRSTVSFEKGEMSFALFDFLRTDEEKYNAIVNSQMNSFQQLTAVRKLVGEAALPTYLLQFITTNANNRPLTIAVHKARRVSYPNDVTFDINKIERGRGFYGTPQIEKTKFPNANHHITVFYNGLGKARLIYKFSGSIQFIQNLKRFHGV